MVTTERFWLPQVLLCEQVKFCGGKQDIQCLLFRKSHVPHRYATCGGTCCSRTTSAEASSNMFWLVMVGGRGVGTR